MTDPTPRRRLVELDALRGLAALAVVLFHYTTRYQAMYGHVGTAPPMLPWGHHGVQLFFAISGFVIFVTLDRTRSLADFAVSRGSRLYPAYWTAILLTTAVVAAAGRTDLLRSPRTILIDLTMLQSFLGVGSVDDVYWTLAVELAFYACMAAIWRTGGFARITPVLLAWLALPWIWTFAPAVLGGEPSWLLGLVLVQQRIAWFVIGIAAYRLRGGRSGGLLTAAALATILACEGSAAMPTAIVVTALMLLVALRGSALLRWPPFVRLGGISYSLYLLHQNIGHVVIARAEAAGMIPIGAIGLALVLALLLATLVTHAVERPALARIRTIYARFRPPSVRDGGRHRPASALEPRSSPES